MFHHLSCMYRSSCYMILDPIHTFVSLKFQDSKDPIMHIANGNIFIPSDHAEHHVLVASLSLQAEFMRVVVPSIDTRVYYTVRSILSIFCLCLYNKAQCKVKNTSEYVLLSGTVKTYLNGLFSAPLTRRSPGWTHARNVTRVPTCHRYWSVRSRSTPA